MSKELNEAIGGRIRAYRESLGMNREAFSEQIGLSPQFLAEAENGKKGLSAESIYKICTSSDMSADYLVLGKIKKDKLKTPLDYALQDMPEEYSVQYVKMLQTMNDMLTSAKKDSLGRNKQEE
ncbi:MAG: helix-turn-helix transcriptional regulator [Lachnospiraceae bacterium]|nr:helix-turn-helix transcriptional regulator [Lachnospiraceae bacterium]MBQ8548371.1 helix-turn-helix transcriptional regulator [Lachnospiraceae bacterium]MBQ8847109.1 helix-turn-helix transcriptional regulator [Lachnospiraceae bacterium]